MVASECNGEDGEYKLEAEDLVEDGQLSSKCDLTVIILTHNEERNIGQALKSVQGWAKKILVVDSYSTDATVSICEGYECHVHQNKFFNYSEQRNFALAQEIETEWALFLDADEWVPEALRREIAVLIKSIPSHNGFSVRFRLIWYGQWVRRGYYPTWILRLFRPKFVECENRAVNEHLLVDGTTGKLQNDLIHENRNGLARWLIKHVKYAEFEARELKQGSGSNTPSELQSSRKRWLKEKLYNRSPRFIRCILLFLYRVILRGGILDGPVVLGFHLLQTLWFWFVVDLLDLENRANQRVSAGQPKAN